MTENTLFQQMLLKTLNETDNNNNNNKETCLITQEYLKDYIQYLEKISLQYLQSMPSLTIFLAS